MLTIDGSFGEGGGQVLRSSMALSMVTGKPFHIERIRAKRNKPGLMRQHLTSVQAAAEVCGGRVSGATIGSMELTFEPGAVRGGNYSFRIGTAGSTTLVLQTVLLPLLTADGPSLIRLEGGTHNPFAPPFDFLDRAYLPLLRRMGAKVQARLERHGFYPAGGGCIVVQVEPVDRLHGIEILERGAPVRRMGRAVVSNLSLSIAEREVRVLRRRLGLGVDEVDTCDVQSAGPGNVVSVTLEHEHVSEVFTSFGKIGKRAELVARDVVRQAQAYLRHPAPVGPYLTDQLMLPMAIAGNGAYRTAGFTEHSRTNFQVIGWFLDVARQVEVNEDDGDEEAVVRFGSSSI